MSTRSGKRIHASVDSTSVDTNVVLQSERNTRSKRQKENVELMIKKRHNYVSYPTDDDNAGGTSDATEIQKKAKKTGKTRRNTLKEQNIDMNITIVDSLDSAHDSERSRKTHRAKKLIEEFENTRDIVNIPSNENSKSVGNNKKRKSKKKKYVKDSVETAHIQDIESHVIRTKGNKKKKGSKANDLEVKIIDTGTDDMSMDFFHSAAGSPIKVKPIENDKETEMTSNCVGYKTEEEIPTTIAKPVDAPEAPITTSDKSTKKKKKSSIKNSTAGKMEIEEVHNENLISNFDESPDEITLPKIIVELAMKNNKKPKNKNFSFNENQIEEANNLKTSYDRIDDKPTTFNNEVEVSLKKRKMSFLRNSTTNVNTETNDMSTTVIETSKRTRRKSGNNSLILDKIDSEEIKPEIDDNFNLTTYNTVTVNGLVNCTLPENDKRNKSLDLAVVEAKETPSESCDNVLNYNRGRKCSVLNSTFDKGSIHLESNENENIMFGKNSALPEIFAFENKTPKKKRSFEDNVLSTIAKRASRASPNSQNLDSTFNKDNDIELNTTFESEIKSENTFDDKKSSTNLDTINVTFDKSVDNSRIFIFSDESKIDSILNHTPVLIESSVDESVFSGGETPIKSDITVTPLKREGTFTKEVTNFVTSPKPKASEKKTPVKRKSSPGCTPFPYSKSSQKDNTKLNVTRSIEKSLRTSSTVEMGPRQTRVMFCSPVNNAVAISQIKGRVIKSNLKGSNKSFVFEENAIWTMRGGRRKRSLTVGETETRAKRKRLGDELQHSVDRLSRPRTMSAAAKLPDPGTPSKKLSTPGKAKPESKASRTKLPNFAALHQKQFDKMESLDECQERKAKRAKQLLTPTGSMGLLERISPKGTPPKPAPPAKKLTTKLHTPSKPKLPTLESLNPGYTRFGFKLNMDVNPFNLSRKTETRKESRTNGTSRQTTCLALPSLAGTTVNRREAAKQAVMREKSFMEKRDVTRKETRTVIKGVRTNRRFELQMKLRNINL